MGNNVNHPDHYQNIAGVEAIDILNDVVKDLPGTQAALLWNSMKYLFRFKKKNGVEDLKKSRNYLDYLIADIEATNEAAKNIMAKSSETAKNIKTANDPCVIYGSKTFGNAKVCYSTHMFAGTCKSIVFPSDLQRYMFIASFFAKLTARDFKAFSIRDVLSDANFIVPDGTDNFSTKLTWKDIFSKFEMRNEGEKYILDFIYWIKTGTKKKEAPKPADTTYGPCVIYHSKVSGKVEVHYSMQMYAGTCTTLVFTSELARDMFMSSFLNKLGKKRFSIRDVLNDANFVVPSMADTFIVKMPWRDLFAKFRMRTKDGKYLLDFIYKHETYESLIKQPANDEHILYKSTVWGSADVYYSTDMPQGTCTKILFDDEGGRNVFALEFFRYLGYGSHGFSIQDILEDAKYMFPKEDNSLHFTMPWNEIFKGFHITDEAGKYALEFIIDLQGGK